MRTAVAGQACFADEHAVLACHSPLGLRLVIRDRRVDGRWL